MVATELTIKRLRWHAGALVTVDPEAPGPSVDKLPYGRESSSAELSAALYDLLHVMQSVNVEINGDTPNRRAGAQIDREGFGGGTGGR